ncbi:TolC family protein [Methylomonas paludis]|uniref:TolC family protein n=1 Tax=Methylomonas paludis TaxID=1173101 RepID=A0A975R9W1_9GAMM|nr:TolC family protein [Methylomonas paludis]QWF70698.1 TolC family protein [Methylomonas paludis]
MYGCRHINYSLPVLLLLAARACYADDLVQNPAPPAYSDIQPGFREHDVLSVDANLNLSQLVDGTLEKYPDLKISEALTLEADALQVRGDSWLAGSTQLVLDYSNDQVTKDRGYSESTAQVEFTPWFWGQKSAAQNVAETAHTSAAKQSSALKLEVARLVRETLWDIALAESRLQQSKFTVDISQQLLDKVRRRVELGDLARADLLLAESEHLQNRSLFTQAQAELIRTQKNYASLTRITQIPGNYREQLSTVDTILPNHPQLEAINAIVARKQATIEWAKTTDTINQPKFNVSTTSTHDPLGGGTNQIAGVGVVIPFGHSTYDAPEIAAAHLELNRVLAQREHIQRSLEKTLHEAERALELSHKELTINNELKAIAETHLKMMETSFAAGEINLMDLLRIQARSLQAIRNAKEQEVKLQRNIAFYNQAVGVLP